VWSLQKVTTEQKSYLTSPHRPRRLVRRVVSPKAPKFLETKNQKCYNNNTFTHLLRVTLPTGQGKG